MKKRKVGRLIAVARKAKGVSQAELGEMIGYKQNTISKIENDGLGRGVQVEDLAKISQVLDEPDILAAYCENCPIRPHVFPAEAPADPAQVLEELRISLVTAADVAAKLSGRVGLPGFAVTEEIKEMLQTIQGVRRGVEVFERDLGLTTCGGACR